MKPRKALILTTAYPYGKGESFLQAELEHIARYFAEVELVPCVYPAGTRSRNDAHRVNLDYVEKRWNAGRLARVGAAFGAALLDYRWAGDAWRIARGHHTYENAKELARALYRAKMFEDFLAHRVLHEKTAFDLVYSYWMVPEIMGAIAFRDKSSPGLKVVSRAHRGDLYAELRIGDYIGLRDTIMHGIDEVYCISEHGRAYLQQRYPHARNKLRTARLGVNDPGYLNPAPDAGRLSLVTCSFAVEEKRLHLIVEAIRYLVDADPALQVKWTHIGDGPLFGQLRSEVDARLGQRAEVVFTGYQTQEQVMALYRDEGFDVFVNVSDSEGIPVSLMEASSVGIPMIATDVGGNSEIVDAGNGIVLAANPDVRAIATALLRFKDPDFAAACRKHSRAGWEQKYNAAVNHDAFGRQLACTPEQALAAAVAEVAIN